MRSIYLGGRFENNRECRNSALGRRGNEDDDDDDDDEAFDKVRLTNGVEKYAATRRKPSRL